MPRFFSTAGGEFECKFECDYFVGSLNASDRAFFACAIYYKIFIMIILSYTNTFVSICMLKGGWIDPLHWRFTIHCFRQNNLTRTSIKYAFRHLSSLALRPIVGTRHHHRVLNVCLSFRAFSSCPRVHHNLISWILYKAVSLSGTMLVEGYHM